MKTRFFNSALPALVMMIAIAGAFAFSNHTEKTEAVDIDGYIPGVECEETSIVCQPDGNVYCTNASFILLYKLNASETGCPTLLFRK